MGTLSLTYDFVDGTTAEADEVDANFATIVNEFNGSIDNDNIKAAAGIVGSKLNLAAAGAIGGTTPAAGAFTTVAASGAVTLSSTLAVTGNLIGKFTVDEGAIIHAPKTYTPSAAATATLDLALGNNHEIQMPAGNITIAISNETDGQYFAIDIKQDSVGSRTVTWFSAITWAGQSAPTLTTTALRTDTFIFKCTGTDTYFGYVAGQNI